jgi:hypothetical protein
MGNKTTEPPPDRFVGITDLDAPIYRIEKRRHLPASPDGWKLHLSAPQRFADPLEDLASWTAVTDRSSTPWQQHFYGNVIPRLYIQCWSLTQESDPLWRAYSYFALDPASSRNRFPDDEGIQLRTTSRKLLSALMSGSTAADECFVAAVEYLPPEEVKQRIANEVGRAGRDAFGNGLERVRPALLKRRAFDHEREVRLVLLRQGHDTGDSVEIPIDPNALYDEITPEPRLVTFERLEREVEIRAWGYAGPIRVSELYQRVLLDVHLGR